MMPMQAACVRTRPKRVTSGASTSAGSRKPTTFMTANEIAITWPDCAAACSTLAPGVTTCCWMKEMM
jgi:hypothetical protein